MNVILIGDPLRSDLILGFIVLILFLSFTCVYVVTTLSASISGRKAGLKKGRRLGGRVEYGIGIGRMMR